MSPQELLAFFEVDPQGKSEEDIRKGVKQAYRRLARKHHPDVGGELRKFQEVQHAYDLFTACNTTDSFQSRSVEDLFEMFSSFLTALDEWEIFELHGDLFLLARTQEERQWLHEFTALCVFAGFVHMQRHNPPQYYKFSFPEGMDIPTFYRGIAMRRYSPNNVMFQVIEKMYTKKLVWNYRWLRDTINARKA